MLKDEVPIFTECNKFISERTVNAVRYKDPEHLHKEVDCLNSVEKSDEVPEIHWCQDLSLHNGYSAYREKLMHVLTEFEVIWNGPLGPSIAVQYWFKTGKTGNWPLHTPP